MKQKLLICGDSFAADWTVKYSGHGWPNMLAQDFAVTNLAQAGCGEYKIYQQLTSANLNAFDQIIVSHTSPNRIFVERHPVHAGDPLQHTSDLIYTDLVEHCKEDPSLQSIVDYFERFFDLTHAQFMHRLICAEIDQLLQQSQVPVLHITNIPWQGLYEFKNALHFDWVFDRHRGTMNHYSNQGNRIVYEKILEKIQNEK